MWHLQGYVSLILEELNFFDQFQVSHIRREGNKEADILSKWALSFDQEGDLGLDDFKCFLKLEDDFVDFEIL